MLAATLAESPIGWDLDAVSIRVGLALSDLTTSAPVGHIKPRKGLQPSLGRGKGTSKTMRKIQTILLALVAVLAFGAITAAGASALEWLVDGLAITGAVSVDSESVAAKPLELEDMGTGVKISCEGTDEGTIEPAGKDKETVVTENLASCKVLAGSGTCKKILAVKAVDLPWKTQLLGTGRDEIKAEGAGAPGWLVECEGLFGIKVDDTCTIEGGSTAVTSLANGTVETLFDANSGEANCTVGGEKQGLVIGPVILLTLDGLTLAVS